MLRKKVVILVLLIGVLVLCSVFVRVFFKDYKIKKEIARLKAHAASLEEKKLRSLELLDYIKTNTFVENEARQKFGLSKEGEKVVIFNETKAPVFNLDFNSSKQLTNPQKWWYYFFGKPGNNAANVIDLDR
jgi:cell division protein FtsB